MRGTAAATLYCLDGADGRQRRAEWCVEGVPGSLKAEGGLLTGLAAPKYVARDLDAVAPPLLGEDVADMAFDGAHAQIELRGYLFVAQFVGDQARNSSFGFGEVLIRNVP